MKLYEWDFAPNCRRVRMFLLEKSIDIPKEECITSNIVLKAPYLAKYPHAMVPMLELEGASQQVKQDRRGRQPSVDATELQEAGKTVVAVTHDDRFLREVKLPVRQLRMDDGRFV